MTNSDPSKWSRQRIRAVLNIMIGSTMMIASASAETVDRAQSAEYLYEAFAAQGRRVNPSEEQLAWRQKAGDVDREDWPSEIVLQELSPVLDQFFGALHGRGFDSEQVNTIFAEDFVGSEILGSEAIKSDADTLGWSRWSIGAAPNLNRQEFAANWGGRYQGYSEIIRTEHYVDRLRRIDDAITRRLDIPFRITGTRDSDGYEDQGHLIVDLKQDQENRHWQIARVELSWLESLRSVPQFKLQSLTSIRAPVDVPLSAYVEYFAQGVTVVDFDADGDLDVFAPTSFSRPMLYRNDGERRFVDVAESKGMGTVRAARSGYFFDWDNDGDQDALILTSTRMHLLENNAGQFQDISSGSNFDRMKTSGLTGATIADYDNDGLLDFYVANYGELSNSPVTDYFDSHRGYKNQLFHNLGDGRFAMVTTEAGLDSDNTRWSFSALSYDYDGDGHQDLYVVNDYGPNQLYRNNRDMTFTDVTDEAGVSDYGNGMAVSLGDLNGDGREDLYVSNMISHAGKRIADSDDFPGDDAARERLHRFAKGNSLFVAKSGGYAELETPVLSDAKWAWGNTLFDFDNDGDLDVYVTNGMYSNLSRSDTDPVFWRHLLAPISTGRPPAAYASGYFAYLIQQESFSFAGYERNRLFQNFGAGKFRDVAAVTAADLVLDSRSVVAADVDDDGDLDLIVASRNEPNLVVLWNERRQKGAFIEVELVGSKSNRNGVGAVVEVVCNAARQRRTHQAGTGYLSQGPHRVWFGIGQCRTADRLDVRWPSGHVSRLHNVPANQRVRVAEDD